MMSKKWKAFGITAVLVILGWSAVAHFSPSATPQAMASLLIEGMTCGGCEYKVSQALQSVGGVESFDIDWQNGKAIVSYNPDTVTPDGLVQSVQAQGYSVSVE